MANTGTDDSILVGDGNSFEEKVVPACVAGTGHLNYDQSTNTWTCNDYIFEGATADGFETSSAVTDPTADRTITFPNATGGVVLDSGTGTAACSN
nr:hypothetical protein [Pseudomonadota bacterium]